jgi:two-component system LytT family sensor kinase
LGPAARRSQYRAASCTIDAANGPAGDAVRASIEEAFHTRYPAKGDPRLHDPSDDETPPQAEPPDALQVRWRVAALVWLVPALLSAMTSYAFTRLAGTPVTFWNALVINIPIWYFWAFATPIIFWLGRVARIGWPVSIGAVLLHLVVSIVAALADVVCGMSIAALLGVAPLGDHVFQRYLINFMSWLLTGVLTYWTVLGAGYALESNRKYQRQQLRSSELAARLARAELSALRNQLHPHFLFNTLNTAVSLVRIDRTDTAIRVLTSLSDILRRLLRNAPAHEITLREELAFLDAYVSIEKIRFPDRLIVDIAAADGVMDAMVPNLLLQPLVENAIRYGIGRRSAAGHIEVFVRRIDDRLMLQVRDDGPGLPNEWLPSMTGGVGLTNTQGRLQQMYGPSHEFVLGNHATGGAEVTIVIPFRLATAADPAAERMMDAVSHA